MIEFGCPTCEREHLAPNCLAGMLTECDCRQMMVIPFNPQAPPRCPVCFAKLSMFDDNGNEALKCAQCGRIWVKEK
jgi:hypothetical protein